MLCFFGTRSFRRYGTADIVLGRCGVTPTSVATWETPETPAAHLRADPTTSRAPPGSTRPLQQPRCESPHLPCSRSGENSDPKICFSGDLVTHNVGSGGAWSRMLTMSARSAQSKASVTFFRPVRVERVSRSVARCQWDTEW